MLAQWTHAPSATALSCCVAGYPNVLRGWVNNASLMGALSTPNTQDWTTKSGMGISLPALTKAKLHWAFVAPTAAAGGVPSRWNGLEDIYFHQTRTPAASAFPPRTDLQLF